MSSSNVKYNSLGENINNMKTDKFNVELMNILSKFSVIDFDLLNKIDISTFFISLIVFFKSY